MRDLQSILGSMDPSLFDDVGSSNVEVNPENYPDLKEFYGGTSKPVYQEPISAELAKALIPPEEFDPACEYQIITLRDATILLRIDHRVSPDRPLPTRKHMTEFLLNTNDEVQTYEEMQHEVLTYTPLVNYKKEDRKSLKRHWFAISISVLAFLLVIGSGLLYFMLNYIYGGV